VQASYSPVIDLNGEITRITNISVDITKEVLAINALEELSAQKDNFIANVSHELRSPIHAIIGFTDLLLESEEDQKKQKQLQSVKTAGDSLLYLVNGILDLSKIEAGLFQFDMRDFNLHTTIENVFSILDGKANNKRLSFSYEIAPDVPVMVNGDPNRLMQVLINLLDNALKFTASGEVKLTVSSAQGQGNSKALTFVVSDTGIGIPEHKLESVFGRFTQAEENTTRKYGGTGLGLNICKLLVEKQGGTIGVKSVPNERTEFYFTINFEVPERKEEMVRNTSTEDYSSLTGKILMCEDNEVNLMLAQQLFASTNLELDIAKNGRIGVEMFRQKKYDLVLMDIQMPEMDGYQATEYIRKELHAETPIIAITAHSIIKEKEKCFEIGMNDYLSKPFKKSELFEKITAWLQPGNTGNKMEEFNFSLEIIKEASMGNADFENQMLQMFVDDSSESIEKIRQWQKEQNWEAISKQAHQLKSSFGMFLMDNSILSELEKNTDGTGVESRIEELEKQILQAQHHIHALINENK
jgi:CheY-like chemotaxis protein/HPt (histidine-containing phosphotransfer) domain-containing protein